jgi:hypothetical protein
VFSGPTIQPGHARSLFAGATCVGPAACGDVLRAQMANATAIVLIDGYFEHTRPVWHKEILWALTHGVHVYGASSLGALRAVELEPFGMVGVGRVFEWFRDGVLEDEDEVTVVHESPERGYRPISDALVNIRATMAQAVGAGVIDPQTASALVRSQKERFYPSRKLAFAVTEMRARGFDVDWDATGRWLECGLVDQKRADAVEALMRVRDDAAAGFAGLPPPSFEFSYTEAWHEFMRAFGQVRPRF